MKSFCSEGGAIYSEEELKTMAIDFPDEQTKFTEVFETFENPGPGPWELERYEGWHDHKNNFEEKIKELQEEYKEWLKQNPKENFEWVTGINYKEEETTHVKRNCCN